MRAGSAGPLASRGKPGFPRVPPRWFPQPSAFRVERPSARADQTDVRKALALVPLVLVAALLWGLAESGPADRTVRRPKPARGSSAWAEAATEACGAMQDRVSQLGSDYWKP